MIGSVIMEISETEMAAAVEFYLNRNLLNVTFESHHKATVTTVRQRSNGRFVIEFDGQPEPEFKVEEVRMSKQGALPQ